MRIIDSYRCLLRICMVRFCNLSLQNLDVNIREQIVLGLQRLGETAVRAGRAWSSTARLHMFTSGAMVRKRDLTAIQNLLCLFIYAGCWSVTVCG